MEPLSTLIEPRIDVYTTKQLYCCFHTSINIIVLSKQFTACLAPTAYCPNEPL